MLSLCIITKNEEKALPVLLQSIVQYVDQVVITDTGSTDKTKEVAEQLCGDKLKWTTFEWVNDFSAARNYNFSQADGEWVIWADADDEITGAEHLSWIIEKCEKDNVNAVMFPYHYLLDEHGNTKVLQTRERLIKNDGSYKWIGKLHEAMLPVSPTAKAIKLTSVNYLHRTTEERIAQSKQRNVEILELAAEKEIEEEQVDPRTIFNLGNAYFTVEDYPKALACYQKYIPMSGWVEEIYLARHRSVLCLTEMGHIDAAIEQALLAIKDKPTYPDAYIDLGKCYFQLEQYETALFWFTEATRKEYPENLPVCNPLDYTANLDWYIGHCYVFLNKFKEAHAAFVRVKQYYPTKEIDERITVMEEALEEKELVKAIKLVGKEFGDVFWDIVPKKYLEFPEVMFEKNQIIRKPKSTGKDMAIYCGKGFVEWDATSETNGGIGGSEEAVINIARLLVQKGWNVTVFGLPFAEAEYDGVKYVHFTQFNPRDKWDVFISWRMPVVMNAEVNAERKYLWLHDTTPEEDVLKVIDKFDKLIVLSQYHRSLYPQIPDSKILMSGNGLNPKHFEYEVKKNPYYCIYTSAPTRGLEVLLRMWGKIKEKVPQAELHWFYGWETWEAMVEKHGNHDEAYAWRKEMQELLKQPGVFEEGRVDHETIAQKYKEAQLWLYPTEFTEIYCITADKAQAGGALPVTTTVAALDERVKYGVKMDVADIYSNEEAQQKYIDFVVNYLQHPEEVELERDGMTEYALEKCSWERIAEQWNTQL